MTGFSVAEFIGGDEHLGRLFHPEFDGVDGVGWQHWVVLFFVSLDQRDEDVEAGSIFCSCFRLVVEPRRNDGKGGLLVGFHYGWTGCS